MELDAKILTTAPSYNVKNSVKILDRDFRPGQQRSFFEMLFFAIKENLPPQKFIGICGQLLELSAKFVKLPCFAMVKIPFKNPCSHI